MNKRLNLNGEWQFAEKGSCNWEKGNVPGCVQTDLMRIGEVDDLFFGFNEIQDKQIHKKSWIYKKEFSIDKEYLQYDSILLVMKGVDTIAYLTINGTNIAMVNNMFIPHEFNIKEYIREGTNTLEVFFPSLDEEVVKLQKQNKKVYSSLFNTSRTYLRKAQYSFGWDWAPGIIQTGIWRPVYLSFINKARIKNPYLNTEELCDNGATVVIGADVDNISNYELIYEIDVYFEDKKVFSRKERLNNANQSYRIKCNAIIKEPKLWYPNGVGQPNLYHINIRILEKDGSLVDRCSYNAGIRRVRIIQDEDKQGKSFIYEINGIKVFAKGANWIPADSMLHRLQPEDNNEYIELARQANFNMIRIWGGGIYEDSSLYDACDRKGIMVWQDFMYSCAQYPDEFPWFRENARNEAEIIVKSLKKHTSIVLWCGGNENSWALKSWWGNGDPEYLGNHIYKKILPDICKKYSPDTPYWISSPYGGEDPNDMNEGDSHSWSVFIEENNYDKYREDTSRFVSEFGFQAMPCWKTVLSFTNEGDRKIFSPVMQSHNKSTDGMEKINKYLCLNFGIVSNLKDFIYLSQINQAEAIKTGVEHWRSRKYDTAGTLFWQYNDCWPAASWSCIDYYKRKKALYYYSKRFYDNIVPLLKETEKGIIAHIINDNQEKLEGTLTITAYNLNGKKLKEINKYVEIGCDSVTMVEELSFNDIGIGYTAAIKTATKNGLNVPHIVNQALYETVIYIKFKMKDRVFTNYLLFDKFRDLPLVSPKIQLEQKRDEVSLLSDIPAFGVFIETENDIDLSDNMLIMEPGIEYNILLSGVPGNIEVFNLADVMKCNNQTCSLIG